MAPDSRWLHRCQDACSLAELLPLACHLLSVHYASDKPPQAPCPLSSLSHFLLRPFPGPWGLPPAGVKRPPCWVPGSSQPPSLSTAALTSCPGLTHADTYIPQMQAPCLVPMPIFLGQAHQPPLWGLVTWPAFCSVLTSPHSMTASLLHTVLFLNAP